MLIKVIFLLIENSTINVKTKKIRGATNSKYGKCEAVIRFFQLQLFLVSKTKK